MSATQADRRGPITATTAAFALKGGLYGINVIATFGGGTVKLQALAADNTTFVSVATATDFAVAAYTTLYLPPGQYRWTIATATAIYTVVCSIPLS